MKFTDRGVEKLRRKTTRYEVFEDGHPGFGLRVGPKGRKAWVWLYRYQGKARRVTLGTLPETSLADAHEKQAQAEKKLKAGIDPGAEQLSLQEAERLAPTVAALAYEYLERHAKPNKRSWREDDRILQKDILPQWKHRKAKAIERDEVKALLNSIVDRGAPIQANRTLAVIRKTFNFAFEEAIVQVSPCAGVKAPAQARENDRVLSEEELRLFWLRLEQARMIRLTKLALKLQLLTAQRKGEVIAAEWNDISGDVWTIPARKAKNNLAHRVPLSRQALAVLAELKTLADESRWLFPSKIADMHLLPTSVDHALRKNRPVFDINSFTPHDLRRTAASHMTALGISRLVVQKILNHKEKGSLPSMTDTVTIEKNGRPSTPGAEKSSLLSPVVGLETFYC